MMKFIKVVIRPISISLVIDKNCCKESKVVAWHKYYQGLMVLWGVYQRQILETLTMSWSRNQQFMVQKIIDWFFLLNNFMFFFVPLCVGIRLSLLLFLKIIHNWYCSGDKSSIVDVPRLAFSCRMLPLFQAANNVPSSNRVFSRKTLFF